MLSIHQISVDLLIVYENDTESLDSRSAFQIEMITTLIVDNEPASFLRLRKLLAGYSEIHVIGVEISFTAAKDFLFQQKPNLILMEVEIPGGSGIDLLPFVDANTKVIFTASHNNCEYAVKAFERGAIDYLLKPISPERLENTMQRVRDHFSKTPTHYGHEPSSKTPKDAKILELNLPGASKKMFVHLTSILWIKSMQNYSTIKLAGESTHIVIRRSLKDWEALLPPERFYRLGRGLIIQLDLIRWTEWRSRDYVLLSFQGSTEQLVIGRIAATKLKKIR